MSEEELDDNLAVFELFDQPLQCRLVVVRRCADYQLVAKLLGQTLLQTERPLVVDGPGVQHTERISQLVVRKSLHADEDAGLLAISGPRFNDIDRRASNRAD